MDLRRGIRQLLQEIGPGRMMSTAYDTAWIARLDGQMGVRALEWLREHQLTDGSWGAKEPKYYHDRMICTLAAMIALAKQGQAQDRVRIQRAQFALETIVHGLGSDPAGETIGFEMIIPTLQAEAETLGVIPTPEYPLRRETDLPVRLARKRMLKLAALPKGMVNRSVTVAFSSEMAGSDGQQLLDVENLQEANGSVGLSPSATAYFVLHVHPHDPAAMAYLQKVANGDGGAPNVAPIDVFEQAWVLWNLGLAGLLDDGLLALCQPHLDFLKTTWKSGQGISFAADYTPRDGDVTSLVYAVLTRFGYPVDLEAVLRYEEDNHFRCYALEANPSISTNIHVLGALRHAGLSVQHPSVQKVLGFLRRMQTSESFWFDKWHASPYYPTAHAIIDCAGYADEQVRNVIGWMLDTQHADGSWGYYMPSAEETAYCLQALIVWKRYGGHVSDQALKRGIAWLVDHAEPPYPPLWIGKCLYCPILVVRSAVLSALVMAERV